MREALALVIGYLLGSVLPADLFARARGVDIRAVGTRNPGATNALQQLGVVPGLLTAAYDLSVGVLAMYVAARLGLPAVWQYLAGVSAILGHVFPVFFRFRGGQGMAATTGLLLYQMGVGLAQGWLTPAVLAALATVGLVVFGLTRSATMVGVVCAPLLVAGLALSRPDPLYLAFVTGLAGWIWLVQVDLMRRQHLFRLAEPARSEARRLLHRNP